VACEEKKVGTLMKINAVTTTILLTSPIWVPAFVVGVIVKVIFIGFKHGFDFIQS
jgi:flagellar biosynthesis protein FliQ